jgi:hypothetical protein
MIPMSRKSAGLLTVALTVLAFQPSTSAHHRWRKFHWARESNPFTVKLGKNLSTAWTSYLTSASADWNNSDVLFTTTVTGSTNPSTCAPTTGRVEVCNGAYGATGWLGVAQVWISGGSHITQGTVKLNDTYFNQAQYNTPSWRQQVVCQEVGHTFGLDHQDENFNNGNLGTCMDYTSDPDGPPSNLSPNAHDFEELAIIYRHLDSFTSARSSTGQANAALHNASEWGQLVKVAHGGKTQIFERALPNGQRVVTFVIWA